MTTRLTFKPRLRINVLFPRLVGFAVDAIWEPGSLTLLSALSSAAGASAAGTAGVVGIVTIGEDVAMGVAGRELTVVVVIRASFAAGCAAVAFEADVREGVSAGAAAVTVPDEAAVVFDAEVRDAFSVGGIAATVAGEVMGEGTVTFREVFSVGGTVATAVGEELAGGDTEVRGCFSPNAAVVAVAAEVATADDGGADDLVSNVVVAGAGAFAEVAEPDVACLAVDVAFADGSVVAVRAAVRDWFVAGVAEITVVEAAFAVTGGDTKAVPAGEASVTARFGVVGSTNEGAGASASPTISMIRRSGSLSVNAVARSIVARSNTTLTVPASN